MSYFGNFDRVFPPPYGQQFVNYQGLLINVVGTTGPFLMPQNQPVNTLNLLTVTSMAGVPTSTPPGGSFAYNSATNDVYVYITGTGWIPITGGGAVETWAQTLVAGNTSGATNPVLSAGRTLIFEDNICIGGSNLPLTSTTAAILIGDGIVPGGLQCVQVGKSAVATAAGCTLIGSSTTGTGASATALGYGAQALGAQATALAYNAQCTTNATAVGVNSVANGAQSSAFGYNATAVTFVNSTALGTGATSVQNNEVVLGTQTTVTRIAGTQLQFGQDPFADVGIAIGTLLSPAAANLGSVAIGLFASAAGSSSTCVGNGVIDGAFNFSTLYGGGAACTGISATAVGNSSKSGVQGAALGSGAWATGTQSVALGFNANTGAFTKSVGLGSASTPTANNQIRMGTATETVSVPGALVMPSALAVGETFKFLTLSGVAGTPTGAALEGSLAMDTTNHLAYLRTNSAWVKIATGTGATPDWSSVLTAGNTTGANNPTINSGQSVIFTSGVAIGSAAVAPSTGTPAVTTVLIGGGTVGSGASCVVIGRSATSSTFASCTAVGATATVTAASGTAVGSGSAAAASSTSVGALATASGSNCTAIGAAANVGTFSDCTSVGKSAICSNPRCIAIGSTTNTNTSTSATLIGTFATLGTLCDNTIVIGDSASAGNGTSDAIVIGTSSSAGAGATGAIVIGKHIALAKDCANNTLIGSGISQATATSVNNSAVGASITFTAGASSTNTIALGAGATVPAGSADRVYFTANFASTTAAAGTAVSIDAGGRFHANTSSIAYKQDVRPLSHPERILGLRAVDYAMKNSKEFGMSCGCPERILDSNGKDIRNPCDGLHSRDVGLIAEEVAAVMPDFVVYADKDHKVCRAVKYDRLVGPLIEMVKMQQERLDILEEQLAKLLSSKL